MPLPAHDLARLKEGAHVHRLAPVDFDDALSVQGWCEADKLRVVDCVASVKAHMAGRITSKLALVVALREEKKRREKGKY
jgi:hypothetical protein